MLSQHLCLSTEKSMKHKSPSCPFFFSSLLLYLFYPPPFSHTAWVWEGYPDAKEMMKLFGWWTGSEHRPGAAPPAWSDVHWLQRDQRPRQVCCTCSLCKMNIHVSNYLTCLSWRISPQGSVHEILNCRVLQPRPKHLFSPTLTKEGCERFFRVLHGLL